MSDWITVAKVGELAPGQWRVVDADGAQIVVINYKGDYFAIEDVCSHDGGQLSNGDLDGDEFICPRHGAAFCIRTGKAMTPPAYDPTAIFPVRVEGGEIQVRDDRWD
ncbi:MAG: non-heme iron oxygenase ferredoxin subunit [Hydrogenophaga sp.]|uniref:non-heme iron oxygenase ferredoxin subunit n=1 Tax=Hydrogenophaga sp. TaxID=1904254 RepID=UPI0027306816|nr:non-heme iron oxygenase ferredoxin subunit [Hydrogenophaga sp.]MDP2164379.1 non-heme iron oxygenase ferredoxin subunit [Hydrogenophaga sp.]